MPTIFAEIQASLEITEAEVERMRQQFRSLPPDHPERGTLLRQLEIAAAVAGELESLVVRPGRTRRRNNWLKRRFTALSAAEQEP